jgi:NAD+ synthase (glutamine-hydrolysing)
VDVESRRLCALTCAVPLLFGTFSPAPTGRLWNELWWAEGGRLREVIRKRLLPLYDVFDEGRYFEPAPAPAPLVDFHGHRIGLCICEDLWADPELMEGPVTYPINPVAELAGLGATLILNASASPSFLGSWLPPGASAAWGTPSKAAQRHRLLTGHARKHGVPVVYASRAGAESWLLFDGGSGLALPDGRFQGTEPFFEGIAWVDIDAPVPAPAESPEGAWLRRALGVGLRDGFAKQGLEAAVVGLSGGIDSAVVAALAAETLGADRVLGVALPTRYSSPESLSLAQDQADRLGIGLLALDADPPFAGAVRALEAAFPGRSFSLTDENLQSRARALLLMALTSEPAVHARLGTSRVAVLNTGNKSEAATGYFTLYGDGIGALGLLGDCLKARVYALARELGEAITPGILHRVPTAELRPGQTDEESLAPYRIMDAILGAHLEAQRPEEGLLDDLAALLPQADLDQAKAALPRLLRLLRQSEFKRRQLPFALKVSPKAFGHGRRIPLTAL